MLPTDPAPEPTPPSEPGAVDPRAPFSAPATTTDGYLQPATSPVQAAPRRSPSILALAIGVVAVLAGSALFMSGVLVGQRIDAQPGTPTSRADAFQPFWDTYEAIEDRYAGGDIDEQAIIRGAIRGMVEALEDPYSAYLTPEEYQSGLQDLSGQFEGIGAEIGTRTAEGASGDCSTIGPDCTLIVVAPLEGSPAQEAGLLAGDAILRVDGAGLDGLTVDGARDKVRGKKGSTVVLTVQRGTDDPFDVSIVRDVIVQREVIERDLADGSIGYIHVTGFSDNSARQFHEALKADVDAGRKKIILDLRGNPGGYVNEADAVASQFLKSGVVFIERGADGQETKHEVASGGLATDVPLVVLVDGGTASSAEIVTGALQDNGRAQIVGVKTFGTGTVLGEFPLSDGSALRVGTVEWLTPDGHQIWHQGITPNVVVERASDVAALDPDSVSKLTAAQVAKLTDPQLARGLSLVTAMTTAGG
jgi:carboxyl-terminal processing protease